MPSFKRSRRAVVVLILAAAPVVLGQVRMRLEPGAPANRQADEPSVFVRDSGVAVEKLALAERMERLREWDKSADVYQEILENFSDRVLPSVRSEQGAIEQYASVALVVQEKLAKWPAEGLTIYRKRYEESARQLIEANPNDRAVLAQVFSKFFVTDTAKQAGIRLIALSLVEGEFTSAAWTGERLLALHPSLAAERPTVLFQTALALHLGNNTQRAEEKLAELNAKFPAATGLVRGQDVNLAAVLGEELKTDPGLVRATEAGSWPTAFGGPERSSVPPTAVLGGAPLFSINLREFRAKGVSEREQNNRRLEESRERQRGNLAGVFPVIDQGELYFQDNARVFAVTLDTGRPLPGWEATYPGERRGAFALDARTMPMQRQMTLTLTTDRVLAVMGQNDQVSTQTGAITDTQLVCLDRATGKRIWALASRNVPFPEAAAALRDSRFYGTPLVVGDTVYLTARTYKPGQIEDCNVVAFGLADGAYKWSSYVASAALNTGFDGMTEEDLAGPATTTHLAYADGRVFVQTNLGAIASLDATDGKIFWLSLYERNVSPNVNRNGRFLNPQLRTRQRGFTFNAPMLVGGRLFALPSDAKATLIFDSGTGKLIKSIDRVFPAGGAGATDKQEMDTLVGVIGDRLVLSGNSSIYCINWPKFDAAQGKAGLFWIQALSPDADSNESGYPVIRGRPFLTGDAVLATTSKQLKRIDLKSGKLVATYPAKDGAWDEAEGPGNVLATPEYLIVAGAEAVSVYTDLALARKRLEDEVAAAPTDAEPRLKYAEMTFAGGLREEALAHLDEAVRVLGGRSSLKPGPARDRLFEDALAFAGKLSRDRRAGSSVTDEFYDRARDAAESVGHQTRYRLARAATARERDDARTEVALYQQVLDNPAWRAFPSGRGISAGGVAEQAIAEALKRAGAEVYVPVAEAAQASLAAATEQAEIAPLIEVADRFPNSSAVVPALTEAAQRMENAGDHRAATRALRRLYPRLTSNESRLRTLEALARNHLALPNGTAVAMARLKEADRLSKTATLAGKLPLPDGRVIENLKYGEAWQLLGLVQAKQTTDVLPKIGFAPVPARRAGKDAKPPLALAFTIDNVAQIVKPLSESARYDRIVAWHPDRGVTVHGVGSTDTRVNLQTFREPPMACAWAGDRVVVIGQTRVALLDDATGKTVWEADIKDLAAGDALTAGDDPVDVADENQDALDEQQMFQRRLIRGRMAVNGGFVHVNDQLVPDLDGDGVIDGQPGGAAQGPDQIVRARLLADRVIVCTSGSRVISLSLATGKPDWSLRLAEEAPRHFMASDDFVVVTTFDEQNAARLFVLDATTGDVLQRQNFTPDITQMLYNVALSPDGTMVTMVGNALVGVDLYDPGMAVRWRKTVEPRNGMPPFAGSIGREQLVVENGHVLAMVHARTQFQQLRVYDLSNGDPAKITTPQGMSKEQVLNAPGGNAAGMNAGLPLLIKASGESFYLYHQKAFVNGRLGRAVIDWEKTPTLLNENVTIADVIVGGDCVLIVGQPVAVKGDRSSLVKLYAYSRAADDNGEETGYTVASVPINDRLQIRLGQWQAVDGGFYYVSSDQKLKFFAVQK